jgi:putative DNA methylase
MGGGTAVSTYKKKLIEVALPLEAINAESVTQKTGRPKTGYPTSIHKYWAQRSIATARAAIWASLVDDPSSHPDKWPTPESQATERAKLFNELEEIISWDKTTDSAVWQRARATAESSWGGTLPPFLDPFAGSGAIPLEALRFGMDTNASDLNPLAVTLERAVIEWAPRFAGMPAVNEKSSTELQHTSPSAGLADDVRYYAERVNTTLRMRIGQHYPAVKAPNGQNMEPGVFMWARTVECPNQICRGRTPLVLNWRLSSRGDKAFVKPIISAIEKSITFEIAYGANAPEPTFSGRRGGACVFCGSPVTLEYVRTQALADTIEDRLLAVAAGDDFKWVFCSGTLESENAAKTVPAPSWAPRGEIPSSPNVRAPLWGMSTWASLYTPRQLLALSELHNEIKAVQTSVEADARAMNIFPKDERSLSSGGAGALAYSEAVRSYLHLVGTNLADWCCKFTSWSPEGPQIGHVFARQAISMNWGYAEGSLLGKGGANFIEKAKRVAEVIERLPTSNQGIARQQDATKIIWNGNVKPLIVTDPPYFDLIEFGELSDFFYVWMREAMRDLDPDLYATLQTPKDDELTASPHRFEGDKLKGKQEFENGLTEAMSRLREIANPDLPLSIYYAYNDRETIEDESGQMVTSSSGWETMLQSLVNAGLTVVATYPFRTEAKGRANSNGTNALAAAILVVCRIRSETAKVGTRAEFVQGLTSVMAPSLRDLVAANIGPIDLAQAAIGPGMSVYTAYSKVLEANGNQMSMGTALDLIHQSVKEAQGSQDATFDAETRWAIEWFSTYRYTNGEYGDAQVLANSAGITMQGLAEAGVVKAAGGKVALSAGDGLPAAWDPSTDTRVTSWEVLHHLMRALLPEEMGPAAKSGGGSEAEAAKIAEKLSPALMQNAKLLAYRLFEICREQSWDKEGMAFNNFGRSWGEIQSAERKAPGDQQGLWEGDSR